MQDDDKQPSYERLDDTHPERNKRSFFDWLRGKEETDEERLRKKLDEELKEAARQRAEQFEQERREKERREVAETKKLKKRWRAKLVEKSQKLLDDAANRDEQPTSGYDIAKLMVAERIVKLHDMLSDESLDLRRSEIKSLKIHIDFMGLLSEKLDRPELEVPEEIEQLYQTIAASVEETTGETPPEPAETEPEHPPTSEADAAYAAFAGNIVQAIRRVLRSTTPEQPENANGDSGEDVPVQPLTPLTPTERYGTTKPEASLQRTALTEQLLSVVKRAALSGEALRQELSHTEQARRLADVVEKAAMREPYRVHTTAPEATPRPAQPESSNGFELPGNKKIKYLSEIELLALAETVGIGSGRLLADAYRKGELDREGLVKVLERYHKGQDYRSEFTLRRGKWRRHKEDSQEYLTGPSHTPQPTPVSPHEPHRETKLQRMTSVGQRALKTVLQNRRSKTTDTASIAQPASSTAAPNPQLNTPARDADGRQKRQAQLVLLVISLLLLGVVCVLVIELSSL